MKKIRSSDNSKFSKYILIGFLAILLTFGFPNNFLEGVAEKREFDTIKSDENFTIPSNAIKAIDLNLEEGEEFEIIYTILEKEDLPFDIWFVNEDNYLLLISDVNFLYYIDGSDSQVSYTKKIVELGEEGIYKLVLTNYNNQTINVNIITEIRTYSTGSDETQSEDLSIYLYPFILIVIILIFLLVVLLFKNRQYKHAKSKNSSKPSLNKKTKKRKVKKAEVRNNETATDVKDEKVKKIKSNRSNNESLQESVTLDSIESKSKISDKVTLNFCGFCGKPVETPFCMNCGRKVDIIND